MENLSAGFQAGFILTLAGFAGVLAIGLGRTIDERDALRREIQRRDDALRASYERENTANARAADLRRALDAAHEAQQAHAAQPGRPCRYTVAYIPIGEFRHLRTVIGPHTHN